jgi:hypothetical protein
MMTTSHRPRCSPNQPRRLLKAPGQVSAIKLSEHGSKGALASAEPNLIVPLNLAPPPSSLFNQKLCPYGPKYFEKTPGAADWYCEANQGNHVSQGLHITIRV